MNIISVIISSIILAIAVLYIISKILNFSLTKVGIFRTILSFILLTIYLVISYSSTMLFLRYLLFIFALTIIIVFILERSFKETFIASFLTFILIVISEFMFALIVISILNMETKEFYGMIVGNLCIAIIMVVLIKIPPIYNLIKNSLDKLSVSKKYYSLALIAALALSVSIIVYINYFNVSSEVRFILSLIIIIVYTIIITALFHEKNANSKIQYEYENVVNNLNEYEKMIDFQKVANHENKNQLLVIKGMIDKKDSKVDEYINSIILEKSEDNEDFLYRTNIIPSGGLRGLVYYKLLSMKEKGINVNLSISNKVRKVQLENMGVTLNKELCKIMGVILDNARQAVEDLDTKNVDIKMDYIGNEFIITVSNNFEGDLDLSEMDNIGYTTKGSGHGYGLALMKQLIDKNNCLDNQKYVYGKKFVQKIILHLSK